ncbi:uncharacterized protein LOC135930276 [Gordionus sp. m RMFG-2023]|uniref:uncharacterized protein LOC135930276 n=1 Tax=Gordionus sp. m RMFG-2023 TaxID=3053472 RepID=UPI0031FC139D
MWDESSSSDISIPSDESSVPIIISNRKFWVPYNSLFDNSNYFARALRLWRYERPLVVSADICSSHVFEHIEEYLRTGIYVYQKENCFDILLAAENLEMVNLTDLVLRHISLNYYSIRDSVAFLSALPRAILKFLSYDGLMVDSELDIFYGAV